MSKNIFNSVRLPKVGSSNFNLSHDVKLSLDMGLLVPTMCKEVLPGDTWRMGCESMIRFAPLVAPVMHRFRVFQHYFFVPNRILWDGFYKWLAGEDTRVFPTYTLTPASMVSGTLADYLGVPNASTNQTVNPLAFAAYQAVYNEFYRDQNLIGEVDFSLVDGTNGSNLDLSRLRRRAWRHDYFTAALPFAQKGGDVTIPLGTSAPVNLVDTPVPIQRFRNAATGDPYNSTGIGSDSTGSIEDEATGTGLYLDPSGSLEADLSGASASSIRDLRRAFKLQEWLERNARAGTRDKELLLAHFNEFNKDSRLDRPEFVYGTSNPVVVSEVLQTAEGTDPVGNMAGHGVSVGQSGSKKYHCSEHGYMLCIMSVMPEPAYQQGVPRHFLKGVLLDRYSYAWPTFQHIGEQEVLNEELYANTATPGGTFGYVPRYSEYKYSPATVHGDFKNTLNHWHDGRIFANEPQLNQTFVECTPDKRIFAVQTGNSIWAQVYHKLSVRRKLSYYSNPGM